MLNTPQQEAIALSVWIFFPPHILPRGKKLAIGEP